jgi:hypothetical protein
MRRAARDGQRRDQRRIEMEPERGRTYDEDVDFQMPERRTGELESGFVSTPASRDTKADDDDLERFRRDREDVPQTPLAERSLRDT